MPAPDTGLWFRSTAALRNRFVMIFCALGLIAVGVNIKLIVDVAGVIESNEISTTISPIQGVQHENVRIADLNRGVRTRLAVLLGIMVVCTGSMIYLFVCRVIFPLQAIARAAEEMAQGNLSVTAPCDPEGRLGELGRAINNLAVNFQEVLLLTGTVVGDSTANLEGIQQALESDTCTVDDHVREQVMALKTDLEMLGDMVRDFQFYQTRFDGQKVVAQRSRTKS